MITSCARLIVSSRLRRGIYNDYMQSEDASLSTGEGERDSHQGVLDAVAFLGIVTTVSRAQTVRSDDSLPIVLTAGGDEKLLSCNTGCTVCALGIPTLRIGVVEWELWALAGHNTLLHSTLGYSHWVAGTV